MPNVPRLADIQNPASYADVLLSHAAFLERERGAPPYDFGIALSIAEYIWQLEAEVVRLKGLVGEPCSWTPNEALHEQWRHTTTRTSRSTSAPR